MRRGTIKNLPKEKSIVDGAILSDPRIRLVFHIFLCKKLPVSVLFFRKHEYGGFYYDKNGMIK